MAGNIAQARITLPPRGWALQPLAQPQQGRTRGIKMRDLLNLRDRHPGDRFRPAQFTTGNLGLELPTSPRYAPQ